MIQFWRLLWFVLFFSVSCVWHTHFVNPRVLKWYHLEVATVCSQEAEPCLLCYRFLTDFSQIWEQNLVLVGWLHLLVLIQREDYINLECKEQRRFSVFLRNVPVRECSRFMDSWIAFKYVYIYYCTLQLRNIYSNLSIITDETRYH